MLGPQRRERLSEVGDQVGFVFEADREPNESGADSQREPLVGREMRVRRCPRMQNQRPNITHV